MVSWIFSSFLYLSTVIAGLYLDTKPVRKYLRLRKIYVLWLYIFLCFGYMTGSDWRSYELTYETGSKLHRYLTEPSSWFVFSYFPVIIPDYWIFVGIAKCIYLYSIIHLISKVTPSWMSVLALLVPVQLTFMLIENPLRFMLAGIVINYVLLDLYLCFSNKKEKHGIRILLKNIILIIWAASFHTSCLIFVLIVPFLFLYRTISKINTFIILVIYILVTIITSNLSLVIEMKQLLILMLQQYMEVSDYSTYEAEDDNSLFSIGNFSRIFFFILVLLSKKAIISKYQNGSVIYGFTVFYFFLFRILFLIPTGFRLTLPLAIFFVVYNIQMLKTKKIYAYVIILYTLVAFSKQLWNGFGFIPYSNSIPYIIKGHKPFYERHMYNLHEYKERTGEEFDIESHYTL